jgi:hypothetical protein
MVQSKPQKGKILQPAPLRGAPIRVTRRVRREAPRAMLALVAKDAGKRFRHDVSWKAQLS